MCTAHFKEHIWKKEKKKDKRELERLRTVACAVSYQSSVWHLLVKWMSKMSSGQSAICSLPTPKNWLNAFEEEKGF